MTADDIETCHRIGKSKGNSKKTIVHFINRKHCKCALVNRKKLKSFNSENIQLPNVKVFQLNKLLELYPNFELSNNDGDVSVDALDDVSIQ